MLISEYLRHGKDNAISGKQLATQIGINHRTLTHLIAMERRKGIPICAVSQGTDCGYFLAGNPEELKMYCEGLKGRAISILATMSALKKSPILSDYETPEDCISAQIEML